MSKVVEEVVPRALSAFAEHEITKRVEADEGVRWYRCQKPGTWVYGFNVTFTPGSVFVTGDIGHLALSRQEDMLPWLRGTIMRDDPVRMSWGYIAEKVKLEIPTREWSEDAARRAAMEVLSECSHDLEGGEVTDLLRFDERGTWEHEIVPKLFEIDPDFWERDVEDFRPRFVYQVMALRRFVELYDAALVAESPVLVGEE